MNGTNVSQVNHTKLDCIQKTFSDYISQKFQDSDDLILKTKFISYLGHLGNVYNEKGIDGVRELFLNNHNWLKCMFELGEDIIDDVLDIFKIKHNEILIKEIKAKIETI